MRWLLNRGWDGIDFAWAIATCGGVSIFVLGLMKLALALTPPAPMSFGWRVDELGVDRSADVGDLGEEMDTWPPVFGHAIPEGSEDFSDGGSQISSYADESRRLEDELELLGVLLGEQGDSAIVRVDGQVHFLSLGDRIGDGYVLEGIEWGQIVVAIGESLYYLRLGSDERAESIEQREAIASPSNRITYSRILHPSRSTGAPTLDGSAALSNDGLFVLVDGAAEVPVLTYSGGEGDRRDAVALEPLEATSELGSPFDMAILE